MTHPLVDRLTTELGWPRLADMAALRDWVSRPGAHVLFVPGDAARNLETPDVAVILPEIVMAFQGAFDCAVVDDAIETQVREESGVYKTPSLIFYRDGHVVGGIPKVRDWDDYIERTKALLSKPLTVEV